MKLSKNKFNHTVLILLISNYLLLCACVCVMYEFKYGCGRARGEIWGVSTCFSLWVLGIELGGEAYTVSAFTCGGILLALKYIYKLE